VELTVKGIMRRIVPGHGFDHQCLDALQDDGFIRGGIHFRDVGLLLSEEQDASADLLTRKEEKSANVLTVPREIWGTLSSDGREHHGSLVR
jgi:hypothetical protein